MIDHLLFHLDGEHDVPVLPLSLDCAGFHRASRRIGLLAFGKLDFDRPDFGETYSVIFRERKARLWKGKGVIAPIALKSWVSWGLTCFDATEKVVIGFLHAPQDIL